MDNESDPEPGISRSEIVVGVLYVVAVGINIYIIADQASDGALSREVSIFYHHTRGKIADYLRQRREFHKAKGQVVWEAMETVNKEGEQ